MAIYDALTPYPQPRYDVAVETRTYLDDDNPKLLVGIPDAIMPTSAKTAVAQPTAIGLAVIYPTP
ncbi:DUF4058 family protein [Fortiea sp. LEGE XX443]|uniref:DUF4058 family protein n=1 Tax=Fortiea sp. LEGE XX443 TaxID=1828611 RepID=UPI0030D7D657